MCGGIMPLMPSCFLIITGHHAVRCPNFICNDPDTEDFISIDDGNHFIMMIMKSGDNRALQDDAMSFTSRSKKENEMF